MKSLRKQIEQVYFDNFVTLCRRNRGAGPTLRMGKDGEVARQRRGIARKIHNLRRPELGEARGRIGTKSGAGRIENDEIGQLSEFLQKFFGVFVFSYHGRACRFRVHLKVSRGSEIGVHADHARKSLRERQCEETNARVKIEGQTALRPAHNGLEEFLNQEAIHLEKG